MHDTGSRLSSFYIKQLYLKLMSQCLKINVETCIFFVTLKKTSMGLGLTRFSLDKFNMLGVPPHWHTVHLSTIDPICNRSTDQPKQGHIFNLWLQPCRKIWAETACSLDTPRPYLNANCRALCEGPGMPGWW